MTNQSETGTAQPDTGVFHRIRKAVGQFLFDALDKDCNVAECDQYPSAPGGLHCADHYNLYHAKRHYRRYGYWPDWYTEEKQAETHYETYGEYPEWYDESE